MISDSDLKDLKKRAQEALGLSAHVAHSSEAILELIEEVEAHRGCHESLEEAETLHTGSAPKKAEKVLTVAGIVVPSAEHLQGKTPLPAAEELPPVVEAPPAPEPTPSAPAVEPEAPAVEEKKEEEAPPAPEEKKEEEAPPAPEEKKEEEAPPAPEAPKEEESKEAPKADPKKEEDKKGQGKKKS